MTRGGCTCSAGVTVCTAIGGFNDLQDFAMNASNIGMVMLANNLSSLMEVDAKV